jgi:hypothetical protein
LNVIGNYSFVLQLIQSSLLDAGQMKSNPIHLPPLDRSHQHIRSALKAP